MMWVCGLIVVAPVAMLALWLSLEAKGGMIPWELVTLIGGSYFAGGGFMLAACIMWQWVVNLRTSVLGTARFARMQEARQAGLLGDKGVILARKGGHVLRFSEAGHLVTISRTRGGNSNRQNLANTLGDMGTHWKQGAVRAGLYDGSFHACRTVADLHEREIAVLKILATCVLEGEVERDTLDRLLRTIVVNQGNCTVYSGLEDGKFIEPKGNSDHITLTIVQQWISKLHQPSALAVNEAIVLIGNIRNSTENETILTAIDQNLNPGNKWREVG